MTASEAGPFVKTGGLGDVLGTVPQALTDLGITVAVVIPRYRSIPLDGARMVYANLPVWFHAHQRLCDIWAREHGGVTYYLVDCPEMFGRDRIYGYPDDHVRFAVLSLATLGVARHVFQPDVLHCHDWHTALVPLYLKNFYPGDPTFSGVRSLFTIHNLYDHRVGFSDLWAIGLDGGQWRPDLLEFYGSVSILKAGLVYADQLSAVSPGYAREIQTPQYGWGYDGLLRARSNVLTGIVNGVDYKEWNPETDVHIAANYSASNLDGKRDCKAALLREFGFPVEQVLDRPLIGVVSRLVDQKGFQLVRDTFHEFASLDMTFILLGSGERQVFPDPYETVFWHLERYHRDKVRAYIGFDAKLAHRIEAGADMFLMPSLYEPCGLNQIYSLRYGTLPIVRATGGLDDTIEAGTGFKFWGFTGHEMIGAIRYALRTFQDKPRWINMMQTAMNKDFSWEKSAKEYVALYGRL
jgi:starch synthase